MLFWHVGGTIAATRYAFRDDRMDLRFLALGAVLPDIVDTPIGLIAFSAVSGVRLIAHSLLFGAVIMTVIVLRTRRGRPRKMWMPLAIGVLMHLVFDAMWASPESLWWPFLGFDFTPSGESSAGALVGSILSDWRVWALEGVGAAYLGVLGVRGRLSDSAQRSVLWRTGRLAVPIDRR